MSAPSGKPIPGVTNLGDVEWALTRARRFIFRGGDPADVEDYVNTWLDYREVLRGTTLERVGTTRELAAAPAEQEAGS